MRRLALSLVAVTALALAAAPASWAGFRHVGGWGSLGTGPGDFGSGVLGGGANRQYDDPAGIDIGSDGSVFVVDTSNNRIEEFSRTGAFRNAFGGRGRDSGSINRVIMKGRFYQPSGLATGGGQLFVSDSGNDRIMAHGESGAFRRRIGFHGSKRGEWVVPWGATTFGTTLYVVDQGNYRVQRWSLGGKYLGAFGKFGRRGGQFVTPYDVAVSPQGDRVYVTDSIRRKVIMFSPTGSYLGEFGESGKTGDHFLKPAGVATGPDGTVFVADRCNRRILQFSATGSFIDSFGDGSLRAPTFLAVAPSGGIYVSDYRRVVVFSEGGSSPAPRNNDPGGYDVSCSGIKS
jgi:DNA-binding beta-propeller fold protein YncE